MDYIVKLHGTHVSICIRQRSMVSKGKHSRVWKEFQDGLGIKLKFSINFYPKVDGKSKRMIKVLEVLMSSYVLDWQGSWEDHQLVVEFAYNNSFHSSIGMTPFVALYGRTCISPSC